MALSTALASLQELVSGLEEKAKKLETRCTALEGKNQLLTDELVKARNEIQDLEKRCLKNEKKLERIQGAAQKIGAGGHEVEGRNAMAVFPEEIWKMIFEYISDPQDLKSCYETCQDFRPLLEDRRTIFLFPDVVKVLAATVPSFGITANCLQLTSRMWRSSNLMMNCRLVCRHWKQGVDQFLEQQSPSFCPIPETNFVVPAFQYKFFRHSSNPFARFTNVNPSTSPMPSRYLVYNENFRKRSTQLEKSNFQQSFTSYLQSFGDDVWTFMMIFARKNLDREATYGYTTLLDYLQLMPNLKELHLCKPLSEWWNIDYYGSEDSDNRRRNWGTYSSDSDDESFEAADQRLNRLRLTLMERPFPNLPTVKTITLEDCPPALVNSVLKANPQIEQLKVVLEPDSGYDIEVDEFELPNLKIAWFVLANDSVYSGEWPLTKLTLDAPNVSNWEYTFNEDFPRNLGNTLQELDLRMYAPIHIPDNLRLNLPKLKILKLRLSGFFYSIDFILPLVNLEYLEVDFDCLNQIVQESYGRTNQRQDFKPLEEIEEVIKMHVYVNNLKGSNVWQLLPQLKQVKARTDWDVESKGKSTAKNPKWYCCTRQEIED